ncbi:uncharacterized protein LOC111258245 [Setaria italica]|uniref:uncharacterized protein LOC111258245 n=1 Tax=Setaria italica TaxID=4555 RepID=UPI000BE53F2B|nr:uncharacterized protein LOC111258245 [Setaria italica]
MPCSMCSLVLDDDACLTSCDNHDIVRDVNDDDCSCGLICTSCIELENEVLTLKQMRDDMSAKLVERNEMSANLEKENKLLRTTYAKCIEKEMDNLRNAPCGTCDRLKHENEVLATRCKILSAKSFDSCNSYHSDVGVSKIASSQLELLSSIERESLDASTCASALDSSSIATLKLVASSSIAQDNSSGKGASHTFVTHTPKPKFHCTFCKMGIPLSFVFAISSMSDVCVPKLLESHVAFPMARVNLMLGTKSNGVVDAFCSKSQGISHLNENDDSSSRTVPTKRPLYHCSYYEKDGHQDSFCYRHARQM